MESKKNQSLGRLSWLKLAGEITRDERIAQKEFQRFSEGSLESLAEKLSIYNK